MDENTVPAIVAETFAVMLNRLIENGWIREGEFGLESEIGEDGEHENAAVAGVAVAVAEGGFRIAHVAVGEVVEIRARDADALHDFVSDGTDGRDIILFAQVFGEFANVFAR